MEHAGIIHDLGWLMVAAGVASVLFRRFKQPAILGYLLAGLLLGKHLVPFSPVGDLENVRQLSELGVVFLMFYIGLEFDLSKLRPVAGASMFALTVQTIAMVMLGTTAAQALGWTATEGLFLGGILSISSSMVTFKLIEERGGPRPPVRPVHDRGSHS